MIRLVLFLLLVQFAAPAYAHVVTTDNHIHQQKYFQAQQAGFTLSVFLSESSEEKNEDHGKANFSFQLIDFASHEVVLTKLHSQILFDHNNAQSDSKPLFTLFHAFLI